MQRAVLFAALLTTTLALPSHDDTHSPTHSGLHQKHHRRAVNGQSATAIQDTDQKQQSPSSHQAHSYQNTQNQQSASQATQGTSWGYDGYGNDQYMDDCLRHHNYHRRDHQAPDIQWDPTLAYEAQQIANSCIYSHNQQVDPQAGQNIAAGVPATNVSGVITDLWYNAEVDLFYNNWGYPQPDYTYFEQWGHMTQMCWKDTLYVGCATAYCPQGLANAGSVDPWFTVCNYKNPGNIAGMFDQMVSPPSGYQQIHSWDY